MKSPVEESLNARLQEWVPACREVAARYARAAGCSADDILNDAVAFVIEHPEKVPEEGQAPWFAVVVRIRGLHAVDRRKRQDRHEQSLEELGSVETLAARVREKDPVFVGVHRAELAEHLQDELAQLPELEAAVLNMQLGGATSRAIAHELKLAPRVVSAVTARANERVTRSGRLRRLFDEAWALPVVACRRAGDGAKRGWRGMAGFAAGRKATAGVVFTLLLALASIGIVAWWQSGREATAGSDIGSGDASDGVRPQGGSGAVNTSVDSAQHTGTPEPTGTGSGVTDSAPSPSNAKRNVLSPRDTAEGATTGAGSGVRNAGRAEAEHKVLRYPDGTIAQEWTELEGQKDGILKIYRENGTLEQTTDYKSGVPDGWIVKFAKDGETVTSRVRIVNGVRVRTE